jgi:hypothetical protein
LETEQEKLSKLKHRDEKNAGGIGSVIFKHYQIVQSMYNRGTRKKRRYYGEKNVRFEETLYKGRYTSNNKDTKKCSTS